MMPFQVGMKNQISRILITNPLPRNNFVFALVSPAYPAQHATLCLLLHSLLDASTFLLNTSYPER